jgi:hypothetical protein
VSPVTTSLVSFDTTIARTMDDRSYLHRRDM